MSPVRRILIASAIVVGLAAVTLTVPSPVPLAAAPQSQYWGTPGTYTWTVPNDVTSVTVDMWGAAGESADEFGGMSAWIIATIPVTPGEVLTITVGGMGACGTASPYGGGGSGGSYTGNRGGAGGGSSDVRQGGSAIGDRVVVVGGGGGGGVGTSNGSRTGGAGGAVGGAGGGSAGGGGGTASAGGAGGGGATSGSSFFGGAGMDGNSSSANGGGGGGGWFGGGGGASGSGGGGGSSYAIPAATDVTIIDDAGVSEGEVTLSWTVNPPTTTTTTTTTSTTTTTTAVPAPQVVLGPTGAPVTTVSAGSSVPMSSSGWLAGSSVTVTMYSTPIDLGTYVANADGTLSGTLIIPANAPVGNHTVVLSGTAANGSAATAQLAFQIVADPTAATPATPAPLALAC